MDEIKTLHMVLDSIINDKVNNKKKYPPIISFEGLPGAGKTTQIISCSNQFKDVFGKAFFIDLPTNSSIGLVLQSIYSNEAIWEQLKVKYPWINALLVVLDLHISLEKASQENYDYVLMSRGLISSYYYNLKFFMEKYKEEYIAWDKIDYVLKAFPKLTCIIFLEIAPEEANRRIIVRDKYEKRPMDKIEIMIEDRVKLHELLEKVKNRIPVHIVDASQDKIRITNTIREIIIKYIKGDK